MARRPKAATVFLYAFDLIELNGDNLRRHVAVSRLRFGF
jgi:hypothetical protein